jgi:hypothetical protein
MRKHWYLAVAAATLSVTLVAAASGHRRPGLWQITMDAHFTKGGPQIPPDQLAKMQQMGIKVPGMGGGPQTIQSCLTPEQAARDDSPNTGRSDCQMQNASWSGNTFSADMVCHGLQGDMHGHITATANSDTSYTASGHLEGTNPHMGGDFAMDNQVSGTWSGADCGSVKPYTPRQ